MGQAEIVVTVLQGQLLAQAVFALAQSGDAPADRRYMLTDVEVQALHKGGVDLPATGRQHLLHRLALAFGPIAGGCGMGSARGEACGSPGAAHDLLPLHRCDCQ